MFENDEQERTLSCMEKFDNEILQLHQKFKLEIPDTFSTFIVECNKMPLPVSIVIDGVTVEIASFILTDDEYTESDLYYHYVMGADETRDYLAFAYGFGNDEFAIKVKGDLVGGIYYIDNLSEGTKRIRKICDSFQQFEKKIKEVK